MTNITELQVAEVNYYNLKDYRVRYCVYFYSLNKTDSKKKNKPCHKMNLHGNMNYHKHYEAFVFLNEMLLV